MLFPGAVAKVFSILVLAQPSSDVDDLLDPLLWRAELGLLRVATPEAALIALRDVAVSLVLICPETHPAAVAAVLTMVSELRPNTPVLLFCLRGEVVPAAGRGRRFAVLRCPIARDVLNRTVDVALGLSTLLH